MRPFARCFGGSAQGPQVHLRATVLLSITNERYVIILGKSIHDQTLAVTGYIEVEDQLLVKVSDLLRLPP
jgi:hypothetical protein